MQLLKNTFGIFPVGKIQLRASIFLIWFLPPSLSSSPTTFPASDSTFKHILILILFKYMWWLQLLCLWPSFPFPKGLSFGWAVSISLFLFEMKFKIYFLYGNFSELSDLAHFEYNSIKESISYSFPHLSDQKFFEFRDHGTLHYSTWFL